MKTISKKTILQVVLCFFLFGSTKTKASVFLNPLPASTIPGSANAFIANPYMVKNNLACTIDIVYRIYKQSGTCVFCSGPTPATILPGNTLNIPIPAGCNPACDIVVTLINIAGNTPVGPIDVSSTHPNSSGSCSGPCTKYNMVWNPGMTSINP